MMRAYSFWTERGMSYAGASQPASLSLAPDGQYGPPQMDVMFQSGTTPEQALAVAEKVLAGVQRWRDGIAEYSQQQKTAVDELAAAREEIARLKAAAGEDAADAEELGAAS